MLRLAASRPLRRRSGSSTIHSKKPIALSTEIPASRNRLARSSSEPPDAAWRSSSSTQGSIPRYPAFSAIAISSTIDSFCPRIVLVFRPRRKDPSRMRCVRRGHPVPPGPGRFRLPPPMPVASPLRRRSPYPAANHSRRLSCVLNIGPRLSDACGIDVLMNICRMKAIPGPDPVREGRGPVYGLNGSASRRSPRHASWRQSSSRSRIKRGDRLGLQAGQCLRGRSAARNGSGSDGGPGAVATAARSRTSRRARRARPARPPARPAPRSPT